MNDFEFDDEELYDDVDGADEAGEAVQAEADDELGAGQSEEDAQREAAALADRVLAEAHGLSDEPPLGPHGSDEELQAWAAYLEKTLAEAAEERAAARAVFEAEEAAVAAEVEVGPDPIDFTSWPKEDFADLLDRVTGSVPVNAARRSLDDETFGRGLALYTGEE